MRCLIFERRSMARRIGLEQYVTKIDQKERGRMERSLQEGQIHLEWKYGG